MAALCLSRARCSHGARARGSSVPLDFLSVILAPATFIRCWRLRRWRCCDAEGPLAGTLVLILTGAIWLYWIVLFVLIATDPD
jgi:hypothetical protein